MTARTTVVVVTRNRRDDLARTLPRHEGPVLLVDNGSTDGTPALAERLAGEGTVPRLEVLRLGRNHGAVARNIGVERARTPYVAFADDDSWWAPGALNLAADLFDAYPRLGLLAARILVGERAVDDPVCAQMAAAPLGTDPDLPGPSILGFLACGAVVRRSAFLRAGGFDHVVFFCGGEERLALDLAAAGWGLAYVDAVVAHLDPSPVRDPHARRVLAARNRLLTTVLRRPWPVVVTSVMDAARHGRVGRAALRAALPRLPRALAARQPLPPTVEAARRRLDGAAHEPAGGAAGAAARPDPAAPARAA